MRPLATTIALLALAGTTWAQGVGEGSETSTDAPDGASGPSDLTAAEIVDRALDTNALGFLPGDVRMTMTVQDRRGDQRRRELHSRCLREDGLNRALVRVVAPPELAGQSYLFRQNPDGEDDIWIFLPALDDAPRHVVGHQKEAYFLGSNLTYADLESRDIRDAHYTRHPDEQISGLDVFVIDSVAEDSAYESIRLWIRRDDFVPLRIRFFREGGSVEKTLFTEEVDRHQGRTYVRRMTVYDRDDNATTIAIDVVDFEAEISPSELTRENLSRH